mgnify:CR=1 FL=1
MYKTLLTISLLFLFCFNLKAQSNKSIHLQALSRADSINQVKEKERQLKIAKLKAIHQAFIKNRDEEIAAENKAIQQKRDSVLVAKAKLRKTAYDLKQARYRESVRKQDSIKKARYARAKVATGEANTPKPANSSPYKAFPVRTYYTGPRGGCYYINSNGNKTYVEDKSLCR